MSNPSGFRTLVENIIAPFLSHAEASLKTVELRLRMSERTFARRLSHDGLTFGEILDQVRREMALRDLAEGNLQSSQIAWLLSIRQSSSFSQGCRRRTGKSPSENHSR